jgi:Holliday junction DNA helicase RuvA
VLAPVDLAAAITDGDVERIDAVPGVGPKVAERIVRELRDKIAALSFAPIAPVTGTANGHASANPLLDDAVSALINLGYRPAEAKRAVEAGGAGADLEATIRQSLAVILGEK